MGDQVGDIRSYPSRKVFVKQLLDTMQGGGSMKVQTDPETGANCVVPMLGGSCFPAAELVRVWIQGVVVAASEGMISVNDKTGTIEVSTVMLDEIPQQGSYIQATGRLARDCNSGSLFVLSESCVSLKNPALEDRNWSLEVLDFQAKFIFNS
eukprot:TRINITY_DN18994_c0_g1_i1.p1 TRINITY_DN18994_c0_g1~~TRINITY_DN18994_c0_g1_i1.p1  ORF type:complete len:174 (+),score=37.91 TRINITY_DN18994_c0_g1_i1:69-524(+)